MLQLLLVLPRQGCSLLSLCFSPVLAAQHICRDEGCEGTWVASSTNALAAGCGLSDLMKQDR